MRRCPSNHARLVPTQMPDLIAGLPDSALYHAGTITSLAAAWQLFRTCQLCPHSPQVTGTVPTWLPALHTPSVCNTSHIPATFPTLLAPHPVGLGVAVPCCAHPDPGTCPCSSCRPLAVSLSHSCTEARPPGWCRSAHSLHCPRTSLILGTNSKGRQLSQAPTPQGPGPWLPEAGMADRPPSLPWGPTLTLPPDRPH